MKLTTVTGKPAKFKTTKAVEVEANRFLVREFKKRIAEGKSEKEAAEMASLSLKYWVGEINDGYFEGSDVAAFMKEENDWVENKSAIAA